MQSLKNNQNREGYNFRIIIRRFDNQISGNTGIGKRIGLTRVIPLDHRIKNMTYVHRDNYCVIEKICALHPADIIFLIKSGNMRVSDLYEFMMILHEGCF
jgi:thiamine pyrophosphokinase